MTGLAGRLVIVTAGPTVEPIDAVRFLSNRSSGRQGYALAAALRDLGARVTLVSGPVALDPPPGMKTVLVETALQMLAAVTAALPADVFIGVAAVADWRPAQTSAGKIKKDHGGLAVIELAENPDILATVAGLQDQRPRLVVGFAAETDDVLDNARAKRLRKGCDWMVTNDVTDGVMGGEMNAVTVITQQGEFPIPQADKSVIAKALAQRIAELFLSASAY